MSSSDPEIMSEEGEEDDDEEEGDEGEMDEEAEELEEGESEEEEGEEIDESAFKQIGMDIAWDEKKFHNIAASKYSKNRATGQEPTYY